MSSIELASLTDTVKKLISAVGEDPTRHGLEKTPSRYVEALGFLTSGYKADLKEIIGDALFDETYDDMVIVRDIEFYSLCEHHMLPFYGRCHVGYIPRGKVIGLSKIPRLVDAFARRLQVQERLTHELGQALATCLNPQGVAVIVEAQHLCMMMRGVQKQSSSTITSFVDGCFKNIETREEFMSHVRAKRL